MYRTSVLGYIWTLMRPLAYFGVLYVVFSHVIRFGDSIPNYAALLLMNIMLFQFFSDSTGSAMGSVVRGESLVRKMHFPRVVMPLANVLTAAMTSSMNLVVVFGFFLASGIEIQLTWLLLPLIIASLLAFSTAVSVLLATAFVWMRDLEHIWTVILRVVFYGTPIFYPLEFVPESFRWLVALNPLSTILYEARVLLVQPDAVPLPELVGWAPVLGSIALAVALFGFALWLFVRQAPRVAEAI